MENPREKFQQLLHTLFQFDCADLDFGIYHIMNYKRQVIERWIEHDLPTAIQAELRHGVLAEQQHILQALEEARRQVVETLGENAIDAEGNLAEQYHETKVGRAYQDARVKAAQVPSSAALETQVYNHLSTFFSRYYEDGDFISKRRYSKKERYAIPYNGEEVYLYWVNHDQYYIKTAEHFTDYTWRAPNGVTVHFKLQAADVEVNNVKGDKRFFVPVLKDLTWDAAARTLIIPFQYRPLTEAEKRKYGDKNQQEKINEEALGSIPARLKSHADALLALSAERRRDANGNRVSYLDHHLRQYTARNTRDFFIHKDLRGFLSRELDFYLKNEVLNLDELEAAGEALAPGWFQLLRLIKRIGSHIIDFLAQIEEFQKALWEKKKFVTETFWCITVGNISEAFYPEIADNEAQWREWQELLHIDALPRDLFSGDCATREGRLAFLKAYPTLVLDTRHFPQEFTDRLLASFENLDEMTDGLLVHSENWQALNLLLEKYRGRVQCVHIDPPYNTQTSGVLYKNDYQHSSWLAMMADRSALGIRMLAETGHFLCHIDDNEYKRLQLLLDEFGLDDAGTIVWDKRNPMTAGRGIAIQHEYVIWRSNIDTSIYERNRHILSILRKAKEIIEKHGGVTEEARQEFARWVQQNPNLTGGLKAYRYLDDDGRVYQSVSLRAPEPRADPKFFQPLIHPVTGKPCPVPPNGFSRTPETLKAMMERGEIIFGSDETTQPRQKRLLAEESKMQIRSIIVDAKRGKADSDALGLETFPYSHPVSLYEELIAAATNSYEKDEQNDLILDFFAGSGTTGHAVINLNREDGGRRTFILVEMAHYFDTVLLPRIKKVTFTPEWKDGRPQRRATQEEFERGPRIVKVIRLESYEDALTNITFDEASGQQALALFGDAYLLRYMLRWESRKSETFLDVAQLQRPFSYNLRIHRDGETREQPVDLPETFAYLIGLDVERRCVVSDGDRRYLVYRGTTRDGRRVVVIWRETAGWEQADYERDAQFVAEQGLTAKADDVYVNGDSFIPGARSLDGVFKARLFGQEG